MDKGGAQEKDKGARTLGFAVAVAAALVLVSILALMFGAESVGFADVVSYMTGGSIRPEAATILTSVRAPRVLAALLAGGALGLAGAIIQSVLDNPLASPNVLGINAGAGLGVLLVSAFFPAVAALQPIAAFLGALAAALVTFAISNISGASRLAVVLAGIALASMLTAGMNAVLIVDPDAYVRSGSFLSGSLISARMDRLPLPAIIAAASAVVGCLSAGRLNVLSLGDTTAHALGMNVPRTRICFLALAAMLAGAAVSVVGLLGFVGLIVPHIVRFVIGHDSRRVLPLSAAAGALIVVGCDLLARVAFAPYEIPVGIPMAIIGGAYFIWLIIRNGKAMSGGGGDV